MKSLLEGIYVAYLSSVNLITEVHGFLEYLKSLAKNKILLQSAISVIALKPGENKLNGVLEVVDLANNVYEPLPIKTVINVQQESSISVPLYSIFEWLD